MAALNFVIDVDTTRLRQQASEANRLLNNIGNTAQSEGVKIDNVFRGLTRGLATLGVGLSAGALIRNIVSIRGEFQQLGIAFETMLGSRYEADQMMREITELALSTPYSVSEVATNTRQLIAMGVAAEDVVETMRSLGDVAAGVSVPIQRIAINYGQVASLGRLQSREVRDFALAGVPILDELANIMGKNVAEVQELVTAGQVGFPLVEQAFKNMSSEGGRFYNLMEKLVGSVTGQLNRLEDAVELMFNEIGKSSEGAIYGVINVAATLVENYEKVGRVLLTLVTNYGLYRAALAAVVVAQKSQVIIETILQFNNMTSALRRSTQAMVLFNQAINTNSLIRIGSIIATLVGVFIATRDRADDAVDAFRRFNDVIDTNSKKSADLIRTVRDGNQFIEERQRSLDELRKLYPDIFEGISANNLALMDEKTLIEQVTIAEYERQKMLAQGRLNIYNQSLEQEQSSFNAGSQSPQALQVMNRRVAYLREQIAIQQSLIDKADEAIEAREERIRKFNDENAKQALIRNRAFWKKQRDDAQAALDALTVEELVTVGQKYIDLINEANKMLDAYSPKKQNKEEKQNLKESEKTYEEYRKKLRDIDNQYDKERDESRENNLKTEQERRQNDLNIRLREIKKEEDEYILFLERINKRRKEVGEDPLGLNADGTVDTTRFDRSRDNAYQKEWDDEQKAQAETLKEMISNYGSYQQRIFEISEKYRKLRQSITDDYGNFIPGASEENLAEMARQQEEDLRELNTLFANRDTSFAAWANSVVNKGIGEIERLYAAASQELEEAEALGIADEQIRARAAILKEQLRVLKSNPTTAVDRRSLKDWQDLNKVLSQTQSEFDKIGQAIGGVAGEAISAASGVSGSTLQLINSMVTLSNWSVRSIELTAQGVSAAIQTVERASVILAAISAGMQIVQGIINAIGVGANRRQEEIQKMISYYNRLSEVYGELVERQREYLDGLRGREANAAIEETIRLLEKQAEATRTAFEAYLLSRRGNAHSYWYRLRRDLEPYTKELEGLINMDTENFAVNFANLDGNTFRTLRDEYPEIWARLSDEVRGYAESIIAADDEMKALNETTTEMVTGISFDSVISSVDDLVRTTKLAWSDISTSFEDQMRDALYNVFRQKVLQDRLNQWYDVFGSFIGNDDTLDQRELLALRLSYSNIVSEANKEFQDLLASLGLQLPDEDVNGASAQARGIATASQESVDDLNGRFAVIQGHTYNMNNNVSSILDIARTQQQNTQQMINHLSDISGNTARLARIEEVLVDVQARGLYIKNI